jgi:multidrug transporter EmrE-like cation transporter
MAASCGCSLDVGQCLAAPPGAIEPGARVQEVVILALMVKTTRSILSMAYLFLVLALTLNAAANVLLKIGATRLGGLGGPGLIGRLVSDYYLLAGLFLFVLNVAFYLAALTRLNLSMAYPIMVAGGMVIVVLVSGFALREAVTPVQMVGLALLVVGMVLIGHRSVA